MCSSDLFATAELQIPVMRFGIARKSELQVIPFLDYGMGWNSAGKSPRPNSLLSTGLGVQFRTDNFNARLDWGIPLKSVESRGSSWQDSGIHFSLRWDI